MQEKKDCSNKRVIFNSAYCLLRLFLSYSFFFGTLFIRHSNQNIDDVSCMNLVLTTSTEKKKRTFINYLRAYCLKLFLLLIYTNYLYCKFEQYGISNIFGDTIYYCVSKKKKTPEVHEVK